MSKITPEVLAQRAASESPEVKMQTIKIITSQAKPEEKTTEISQQQPAISNTGLAEESGLLHKTPSEHRTIPSHAMQGPSSHNPQYAFQSLRTHQLLKELRLLHKEKREVEIERNSLRLKIQDMNADLTACRDTLFSLQPQEQSSDQSLNVEWEALCQVIASWVDDEIETNATLEEILPKLQEKDAFKGTVTRYWGKDKQKLAHRVSGGFDDLIKLNMHQLLEQRIFNNPSYLVGLTHEQSRFLRTIETRLANLEPPRGE